MTALNEYIDKITEGNPLLAGVLNTFITEHNSRFGSAISEDELLNRLKQNLERITLLEGELSSSYTGFDEKKITAGCVNERLQESEYLSQFTQGLRRELIKAIYTVPKATSYRSESLLFGTYEKLSDNSVLLVGGNDRFKDALVTYIEGTQKCVFDEFSKYAGEKTLITAAFNSNEEDFRKLFDAFDIDKAYSSFAEHLGSFGDEDTDFFKEFYAAYLPGASDRNIIAQAPFWKEKKYRKALTEDMDESVFKERLLRAFDHEVQLHPEYREAILRGENAALVNLVKEEYLNDIHLEKERELEKESPEIADNQPVEGMTDDETYIPDEEETAYIDDISSDEEEKQRKKEEREKRAAFSKRRNEQYASSNAEIDERHWQENEYLASRRRIEEERQRVQKFYEDAMASSTLKQVDTLSYSAGSDQSRYKDEEDYYRKTRQESDEYYERLRREEEKREQYKAYQDANDREYYKRLSESENYISKNTEGHINFNEKDKQPEYQTEGYSPIYEEKEFTEKPFQGDVGYESKKFSATSYGAPEPELYRYEPIEGAYSDPLVNVRSDEYLKAEYDAALENARKADYVYRGRYSDNNMYEGTHV
ncbi:MAG: hypothetical protein ACI4KE_04150, partial [Anaerovoracaceae bacterium]